jgi:hypothetical protein
MRAHIQPPSKTGVTGVTGVTPFTKRLVSLAFTAVTQQRCIAYIGCNAAHACNAKVSILGCGQALGAPVYQANFVGSAFRGEEITLGTLRGFASHGA